MQRQDKLTNVNATASTGIGGRRTPVFLGLCAEISIGLDFLYVLIVTCLKWIGYWETVPGASIYMFALFMGVVTSSLVVLAVAALFGWILHSDGELRHSGRWLYSSIVTVTSAGMAIATSIGSESGGMEFGPTDIGMMWALLYAACIFFYFLMGMASRLLKEGRLSQYQVSDRIPIGRTWILMPSDDRSE